MPKITRIAPCLWFDNQALDAANLYVSIFPNSKITAITRYSEAGQEIHRQTPGAIMAVSFELDGHPFTALNGGPIFKFNEAISLQIYCETQAEIDHYWEKLTEGADPNTQQCGWLKDRFGLSWQVVPVQLDEMLKDHTSEKACRVMNTLLEMKKLDLAALQKAYES
jgi:predicted 3-demethylubiquinone-9 3-methyltransferase (glyoxalase superfamily)